VKSSTLPLVFVPKAVINENLYTRHPSVSVVMKHYNYARDSVKQLVCLAHSMISVCPKVQIGKAIPHDSYFTTATLVAWLC
jgi:hypothetical protein